MAVALAVTRAGLVTVARAVAPAVSPTTVELEWIMRSTLPLCI